MTPRSCDCGECEGCLARSIESLRARLAESEAACAKAEGERDAATTTANEAWAHSVRRDDEICKMHKDADDAAAMFAAMTKRAATQEDRAIAAETSLAATTGEVARLRAFISNLARQYGGTNVQAECDAALESK